MNTEEEKPDSNPRISKEFLFLFLFLFLVLAASCVFMHSFVAPLREEVELIKLEVAIKEKNIESRELWLSRVVKLNEKNEVDEENIKKINSLVPNRNNYEDYLAHIIKLASNKNIIVDGFSVSGNQKKDNNSGLNSIKISFSASGGYSNFISFLEDIERSIPFTQVESVAVAGGESDQGDMKSAGATGSIINFSAELSFNYY